MGLEPTTTRVRGEKSIQHNDCLLKKYRKAGYASSVMPCAMLALAGSRCVRCFYLFLQMEGGGIFQKVGYRPDEAELLV